MNELPNVYRDLLVEHAQRPRHAEVLSGDDVRVTQLHHPTCNDHAQVSVKLTDDHLQAIGCVCSGCAITIASGSLMAERLNGVSLDEATKMYRMVRDALERGAEPADAVTLGEAAAVVSARTFPLRVKCALLPWLAMGHLLGLNPFDQKPKRSGGGDAGTRSRADDEQPAASTRATRP